MSTNLKDYYLVLPLKFVNFEQPEDGFQGCFNIDILDHRDVNQIFVSLDEKIALNKAKKLSAIFPDNPIIIFKCCAIVEATGKCPYVVKKFNKDGELIPVEVYLGR